MSGKTRVAIQRSQEISRGIACAECGMHNAIEYFRGKYICESCLCPDPTEGHLDAIEYQARVYERYLFLRSSAGWATVSEKESGYE